MIVFLLSTLNCSTNSYKVPEVIDVISDYIANNYYWTEHRDDMIKLYPENLNLKIKILIDGKIGYGYIDYLIGYDNDKYKRVYRVINSDNKTIDVNYYFNDSDKIQFKIDNSSNYYRGTVTIPSKWEPNYPPVEGIKLKVVENIKKLTIGFINTAMVVNEVDKKKLEDSEIVLYLKDFYIWEKKTTCLVETKIGSAFCNINIYLDGTYNVYMDMVPTKWRVPKGFKVEGYNGDMQYMRRFAKYNLKYKLKYEDKIYFNE